MIELGTENEGLFADLFRGKTYHYTKCKDVEYQSSRVEEFYGPIRCTAPPSESFPDISLNVKNCPTLLDAFEKFCEEEVLEGENQFKTDKYGYQVLSLSLSFSFGPFFC